MAPPMLVRELVAALALLSVGCSGSTAPGGSLAPHDAAPSDGAAADASLVACDAGPPVAPYATSQPFECNESLQTITTREPVTLSFDLVVPPGGRAPTAVVVLLAGGSGLLHLTDAGIGSAGDNFCVRTRQAYATNGFVVAVPDAPSDHDAGLDDFRAAQDHATDLGALIDHMRQAYPGLPVWLVSTSRGTISATNAMARLDASARPDHLVLTSSVTFTPMNTSDQEDIHSVPGWRSSLSSAVPILMIDDSLDQCGASPPISGPNGSGAQVLAQAIGDEKYFVLVDGGPTPPPDGGPDALCGGLAYHGFYENDDLVVAQKIIPFIQGH
jgi:hypothetical protein